MPDPADEAFVEPLVLPGVPEVINTPANVPQRLDDLESLVKLVFIVIIVSVGALVVSVAAIILDQLHFNNQIYRDGYSKPVQTKIISQPAKTPDPVFTNLRTPK